MRDDVQTTAPVLRINERNQDMSKREHLHGENGVHLRRF